MLKTILITSPLQPHSMSVASPLHLHCVPQKSPGGPFPQYLMASHHMLRSNPNLGCAIGASQVEEVRGSNISLKTLGSENPGLPVPRAAQRYHLATSWIRGGFVEGLPINVKTGSYLYLYINIPHLYIYIYYIYFYMHIYIYRWLYMHMHALRTNLVYWI